MKDIDRSELERISCELLGPKAQEIVEEKLDNDDTRGAQIFLMGAVDRQYSDSDLSFEQARGYYVALGVSPEEASKLRQQHGGMGSA